MSEKDQRVLLGASQGSFWVGYSRGRDLTLPGPVEPWSLSHPGPLTARLKTVTVGHGWGERDTGGAWVDFHLLGI